MKREDIDKLPKWAREQIYSQLTVPPANVEQDPVHAVKGSNEGQEMVTPCRIRIHSKRKRRTDSDGISAKFVIDGLVHGGLLPDDSPKEVKEVLFSQELSKAEETIITIETI